MKKKILYTDLIQVTPCVVTQTLYLYYRSWKDQKYQKYLFYSRLWLTDDVALTWVLFRQKDELINVYISDFYSLAIIKSFIQKTAIFFLKWI